MRALRKVRLQHTRNRCSPDRANLMRIHVLLAGAVLLIGAAFPRSLCAQFQEPTPDELKMTADPKAPGASAVYLYREETTDNELMAQTYYARIKVLTEKGKELATVSVPFVPDVTKVDQVVGRTIHPDGTIVPLSVKPEDLMNYKSKYFQEDTLVFTLPDVEVGSILEYRLRIKHNYGVLAPRWELQSGYFTHKEHFQFNIDSLQGRLQDSHGKILDRLVVAVTPPKAPVSIQTARRSYFVDLTDVAPVPSDDWMPPINTLRWRVEFYYTFARSAQGFWDTECKFWKQDTEEFIHESGTIKKAAAGLISDGDTDEEKARKIYAAVMKLDNTDFSRVKTEAERKKEKLKEIHSVDDVWKNQSGAGNSIALLYVALARAAGLKVWPMQVVDRNLAIFDVNYFNVRQLDDYIAVVNIGGKDIFVDPAQKAAPFGSLHWAHALVGGIRESETGPVIAQTPASTFKENVISRIADLTVDGDGNVTGTARIVLSGAEALYWRQVALQNDEAEVKKQFDEDLRDSLPEGVDAEFDHFVELANYQANLMAIVKVSGRIGTMTGKRFFLPGLFFESRAKHPFVSEDSRTTPIDVRFPRMENDDVVYHLPPGYTVESSPRTNDVTWPNFAMLRIGSKAQQDTLEVARAFARNFTLLGPESYKDLHDLYLKVAAADQQQIVLVRAPTAKGN